MKIRCAVSESEGEGKVRGACSVCKIAHTACDGQRPCKRCVAVGKADQCFDVEPKKRACGPCRSAHTACDSQRPCKRCVSAGRADMCVDPELRKKGRRPKAAKGDCDTSTRPTMHANPAPSKRQRVEGPPPVCAKVTPPRHVDEAAAASSAFPSSPPLSPLLPPPFPLPNLHPAGNNPGGQHPFGSSFAMPGGHINTRPILASAGSPVGNSSSPLLTSVRPPSPDEQPRTIGSPAAMVPASLLMPSPLAPIPQHHERPATNVRSPSVMSPVGGRDRASPQPQPFSSSPSSSSPRSEEHGSPKEEQSASQFLPASSGATSLSQLEMLLAMFMKELRELKATNDQVANEFRNTTEDLRKEILLLHQNQQKFERRLDQSLGAVVAVSPSSSGTSFPSSPGIPPHEITAYSPSVLFGGGSNDYDRFCAAAGQQSLSLPPPFASSPILPSLSPLPLDDSLSPRSEILRHLPFLADYNIQSPEVPFVVDNIRKPYFALQIMESMPGEEFTPPIFIFANAAFCSLVRYSLHELRGCPLSKVSFPDEKVKRQLLSSISKSGRSIYLPQRGFQEAPPSSSSEIIRLSPLFLPRNGRITRLSTRVQFFYNEHGRVKWKICCVDGLEESGVIEMPINWLPGLPKWWTTLPLSLPGLQQQVGFPLPSISPRIAEEVKQEDGDAPGDSSPMEEAFLSSFIAASPPSSSSFPVATPPPASWASPPDEGGAGDLDY